MNGKRWNPSRELISSLLLVRSGEDEKEVHRQPVSTVSEMFTHVEWLGERMPEALGRRWACIHILGGLAAALVVISRHTPKQQCASARFDWGKHNGWDGCVPNDVVSWLSA